MSTSTTVCEAFQRTSAIAPDQVALRTPGDGVSITWREYAERVRRIAAGLDRLGLRRGETLAFMLNNRPEFALVDTAATHLGAIPFSVYNTSSPEQLEYLFTHAENRIVVTERTFLDRIQKAGVAMEHVVCVDGPAEGATVTLADLEQGEQRTDFDFESTWRAVSSDDICTLIYTSGTTGPRGTPWRPGERGHSRPLSPFAVRAYTQCGPRYPTRPSTLCPTSAGVTDAPRIVTKASTSTPCTA
jgi:long-chain acyl-CoA synthetase